MSASFLELEHPAKISPILLAAKAKKPNFFTLFNTEKTSLKLNNCLTTPPL